MLARHAADRLWQVGLGREPVGAVFIEHQRDRHEGQEARRHAHRARARTAAAVRGGEGLVQVHVDDVEAHVARTHLAENRVEVGAVVIREAAGVVDDFLDVGNRFLEYAERRRIGQHQSGGLRTDCGFQRVDVDGAGGIGRDFLDRVAAHGRGRRVGAVRRVRHDDLAPRGVAARIVVGADHRHPGELAVRARHRRHRHAGHAGHVLQHFLQLEHAGEETLSGLVRARRMARQKLRQHRQRIARARVVLHRARAERVELRVDREVLLRKPRVVAHHVELGDFRQRRGILAAQRGRQVIEVAAGSGQLGGSGAAGAGMVEYQHDFRGQDSGVRDQGLGFRGNRRRIQGMSGQSPHQLSGAALPRILTPDP
jgi:hypothetical protein